MSVEDKGVIEFPNIVIDGKKYTRDQVEIEIENKSDVGDSAVSDLSAIGALIVIVGVLVGWQI